MDIFATRLFTYIARKTEFVHLQHWKSMGISFIPIAPSGNAKRPDRWKSSVFFESLYLGFPLKDLENVILSCHVLNSNLFVGQILAIGHTKTAFKDTPKVSVNLLVKFPQISALHVHKINFSWCKNSMCIPDELNPWVRRKENQYRLREGGKNTHKKSWHSYKCSGTKVSISH